MNLGLIGCGKMGSALLKGFLKASKEEVISVSLCDNYRPSAETLAESISNSGASVSLRDDVNALLDHAEVILLCVKPNDVQAVLTSVGKWEGKLLLSVAAGVDTRNLAAFTDFQARIIRVMPNTPSLIGQGASAFSRGHQATDEDAELASQILSSVGTVNEVAEKFMDAVTGLSGSGPAYVYTIIEALSDAGVKQGLPRNISLELACQTLKGATMMVQETGMHPAALRDQVTSPGGTTITGVATLEEKGLRSALISAVESATLKSKELGGN